MAKRGGGFTPSSPRMDPTSFSPPETPARSQPKTSGYSASSTPSGAGFRQVRLHATPGEAPARSQRGCSVEKGGKSRPTPPQTPTAAQREPLQRVAPADSEDRDLSPTSTTANMSIVGGGSQYEASTSASDTFSGTKILLKASEMIHGEVKSCENRVAALFEAEREARDFSNRQLRQDIEAMVTIVETLSSQVNKAPVDSRLDAFLEQEKRARDSLREDFEALADQMSALDEDRQRDPQRGASMEDIEDLRSLLEQDRKAQSSAFEELRRELRNGAQNAPCEDLRNEMRNDFEKFCKQERSARDLSNAVLRKDFRKDMDNLSEKASSQACDARSEPPSQIDESRVYDVLEQQRVVLDRTCAELRKDIDAVSVAVRSLPSAEISAKCTGSTGNSEDEPGSNLEVQHIFVHRLQQQKDEVDELTEHLRMDLASSSQVVHLRLEKIDQAINDLQWDMRASQALERCLVDAVNLNPEKVA